jgi:DNA-binding NarL/FixJ family response regulator
MSAIAPDRPTRVFLCDDNADMRMLLSLEFGDHPDLEVVGEAGDGEAGVRGVAESRPDVVLLDLAMPVMDGLEAIPHLHALRLGARIVVLTGYDNERIAADALQRCASRYLSKASSLCEIVSVVREVASAPPKVCADSG